MYNYRAGAQARARVLSYCKAHLGKRREDADARAAARGAKNGRETFCKRAESEIERRRCCSGTHTFDQFLAYRIHARACAYANYPITLSLYNTRTQCCVYIHTCEGAWAICMCMSERESEPWEWRRGAYIHFFPRGDAKIDGAAAAAAAAEGERESNPFACI